MILEMTAGAALVYGVSRGISPAAGYVADQLGENRCEYRRAFTLGPAHHDSMGELVAVFEECSQPGWDGYEALPVEQETYVKAYCLLENLPGNVPAPEISAEPDGHLTFGWYSNPNRVISVSISPEGELHYAALLGTGRHFGTETYTGQMPARILELVHQVVVAPEDAFVLAGS